MKSNVTGKFGRLSAALVVLAIATLLVPPLLAQSLLTGDIAGTVSDPSGAIVPNASVTLTSLDRGDTQATTTNSSGYYRFSLLKPGQYSVTVTQQGFKNTEARTAVNVGQVAALNFALELGQAAETVEVSATAVIVNTENPGVSTSFDQRVVQDTPNPGGDLTNIAQMAPGATMNTSQGYGNLTVNGLPATSNLFTVNGENNMDPFFNINNSGATNLTLGVNEIQEATVITNPYNGQYGQQSGAQVTYVTKSGTNNFHGSVKYNWNGRVMNANDWFANNSNTSRPFANANQWGADLGGPIIKNKTFFYADYEGLRYVLPTVQNTYLITPVYANAVLANIQANQPASLPLYQQLFGVWLGAPGAQNATAQSGTCPTGTSPGGTALPFGANDACIQNFVATPNSHSNEWIFAGRVDQNIGNRDRVFFRYRMDRGDQATYTDPINANFDATSKQPAYDGQLNWTHTVSPSMTNQFLATLSWYSAPFLQDEAKAVATFPFDVTFSGPHLTNFARLRSFPQGRNVTQYQFIDDVSKVHGNHDLKFGVNFRRFNVSDHNFFYKHPRLLITDLGSFFDGTVGATGYVRQDFGVNNVVAPIALYGLGFYAQDDWRVKSNLKLTLALRAERNANPTCRNNCFSQLTGPFASVPDPAGTVPYNQFIKTGLSQPFKDVDAINFSPRFGFAWSPRGSDKTVVSGGIGIFYDALAQGLVESAFQNMPGYTDYRVADGLWADPGPNGGLAQLKASAAALDAGFSAGASYSTLHTQTGGVFRRPTFANFAGTFHTPQYQEWNLQVQHQIGNNMSVLGNYFGTHGIYIPITDGGVNAYDPFGVNIGFPSARLNNGINIANETRTGAISNSNGMNIGFRRRFSHGIQAQINYTWAHGMDEVSNGGAFIYGNDSFEGQFNPTSLRSSNYGNSDYDIRHNLAASTLWEPPFKFGNKFVNGALGGWSLATTWFARTGLPYSVLDENIAFPGYSTYAGVGFPLGALTGTTSGQQSCGNPRQQCFNLNAFVDTNANTFSGYNGYPTQRRNQYRGPNFFDMNMTLMKNFNVTERVKLGIGANFYNLFNHPNFANPNWALAAVNTEATPWTAPDPTVGFIQSTVSVPASPYGSFVGAAASGRLVQLEGRIRF